MGGNLYEHNGKMGYKQPQVVDVYMRVVGDDSNWKLPWQTEPERKRICENFDHVWEDGDLVILLPPENAVFGLVSKSVQKCAYNATQDYLRSMLGPKLDLSDEAWFSSHPLTNSSGLPQEHTITVLNDLVKPYGIGVSAVFCRKGTSASEEQRKWQKVLGINPKALVDRDCSNEEFLKMLNPENLQELDELLRPDVMNNKFEYVDKFQGPGVIFASFGVSTSFATGGGHATYLGPRGFRENIAMAIRFDYLENITYKEEPPTMDDTAVQSQKLFYSECKDKNGKKFSESVELKTQYSHHSNYGGNSWHKNDYKHRQEPKGHKQKSFFMTTKELLGLIDKVRKNGTPKITVNELTKLERRVTSTGEDEFLKIVSEFCKDELSDLSTVANYLLADDFQKYVSEPLSLLMAGASKDFQGPSPIKFASARLSKALFRFMDEKVSRFSLAEVLHSLDDVTSNFTNGLPAGVRFGHRLVMQAAVEELIENLDKRIYVSGK